jgi:PTS system nitrogen regulatory IIA component
MGVSGGVHDSHSEGGREAVSRAKIGAGALGACFFPDLCVEVQPVGAYNTGVHSAARTQTARVVERWWRGGGVNLEEVLPTGCVLLDLGIADKAHVLAGVAKLLAKTTGTSASTIETALLARETLGSTGVGGGVALPHARLHTLTETHGVFVRLATPIAFDALDSKPVDLVCGLIAPDEPNAELLTALSAVSRVLRDAAKTTALRKTYDAAEARRILTSRES